VLRSDREFETADRNCLVSCLVAPWKASIIITVEAHILSRRRSDPLKRDMEEDTSIRKRRPA
jgi:hypothetical protein